MRIRNTAWGILRGCYLVKKESIFYEIPVLQKVEYMKFGSVCVGNPGFYHTGTGTFPEKKERQGEPPFEKKLKSIIPVPQHLK
jgi:hypothetical protein